MSNEINQNELLRLCGKVRDQCISDAEFVRLEQMLRDDSGALQFYRRFMSLCSSMEQISDLQSAGGATDNAGNDSISDSDSDSGAFAWIDTMPRSELAKPTPSTIPAAAPVRINRKRWIAAGLGVVSTVAAAIALMLVSVGPSSSTERFASLVDSRQAVWIGENQPADGAMLASVDYTLASGAAQLRYDNGAILLIQAPAVFSIDAEKQATLRSGSLALTVPPTATGFRIQTPQGTVVDLGTRIGVMTDEEVGLEVHVFEGRAEAIQANATRGELLEAGQAAVLSPENKFSRMPADHSYFVTSMEMIDDLPQVSGDVELLVSPPRSVKRVKSGSIGPVRATVFAEQTSVVLAKRASVTLTQPGVPEKLESREAVVPSGVRVDSFLIDMAVPRKQWRDDVHFVAKGEVQFERPILGVVTSRLTNLGDLLGHPATTYPRDANTGLEDSIGVQPEHRDRVELSEDRRTLRFQLHVHGHKEQDQQDRLDQLRILVESIK